MDVKFELLRDVADGKAKLTEDVKNYIEQLTADLGLAVSFKRRCRNCYIDAAVLCYQAATKEANQGAENGRKYVLKKGVDLTFGGVRVCAATLTDELAADIISRGFATKWFAKKPE